MRQPASQTLATLLRQAIAAGEYRAGDRLPSQRVLARTHGVAMNTAREAYRALADEGLVRRHQGKGVFVTTTPHLPQAQTDWTRVDQLERDVRSLCERVARLESEKRR